MITPSETSAPAWFATVPTPRDPYRNLPGHSGAGIAPARHPLVIGTSALGPRYGAPLNKTTAPDG